MQVSYRTAYNDHRKNVKEGDAHGENNGQSDFRRDAGA